MTLDTLKIEFQADTAGLQGSLAGLTQSLEGVGRSLEACAAEAGAAGISTASAFARGVAGGAAQARSAGGALAAGFAQGISARAGEAVAAARRMVNAVNAVIRGMLQIHSPSRVAAGFGARFGQGFAEGIDASLGRVERVSARLAEGASGALGGALPEAVRGAPSVGEAAARAFRESLSITVPLNVDGMKLGEASIRGINAVTRSAGRVTLEL